MKNNNTKKEQSIDKSMEELFVVLLGAALIEHTKHDPALNKAARKKSNEGH